jgi:hypothetical protein
MCVVNLNFLLCFVLCRCYPARSFLVTEKVRLPARKKGDLFSQRPLPEIVQDDQIGGPLLASETKYGRYAQKWLVAWVKWLPE